MIIKILIKLYNNPIIINLIIRILIKKLKIIIITNWIF
jgi:hypothetical protein